MAARRKGQAQEAPTSRAEAEALIARYATLTALVAMNDANTDAAIAELRSRAAATNAPIDAELKDIFARLRAWWAVAGEEIAGKRRSAELAGVEIGVRKTPPSLKITGKPDDLITRLRDLRWAVAARLIRTKYEIDKPACIEALREPKNGAIFASLGVSAVSKDEFFIALRPIEQPTSESPPA